VGRGRTSPPLSPSLSLCLLHSLTLILFLLFSLSLCLSISVFLSLCLPFSFSHSLSHFLSPPSLQGKWRPRKRRRKHSVMRFTEIVILMLTLAVTVGILSPVSSACSLTFF
jgi:hypothetical protein